ncbi:cell wall-binding repeat-containing protein [Metaclostridioides mangenotii]|uniref:Repeat protein (TIGR02543 family) n=1 Tax=Metaclostridioides mangenotii TaxID=1540 RepID=A0ABS4EAG8_9FIRM|nr:cell wall-binding repeat-containing protein [Clostridioides mangenotii]MBP1854901.1 putative repeat protein (TIGR02543 family) [Clostridioides mangenotii]
MKKLLAYILIGVLSFNGVYLTNLVHALEGDAVRMDMKKADKSKKEVRANEVYISAIEELKSKIETQTEDLTIKLSDDFPVELSEAIVIDKGNSFNLTIDGSNLTLSPGSGYIGDLISVNKNSGGRLEIKNININGKNETTGKLLNIKSTNGNMILENMELTNSINGAIWIPFSGNANVSIKLDNMKIANNKADNSAPAIRLADNCNVNLEISNSIIENNSSTGYGYECGAIASKSHTGDLVINNTMFRNNVNGCLNSGVVGGGGGAMSLHYLRGNLKINESYFYGNETSGEGIEVKNTYDGGAIYILDGRDGATVSIDKTTFDSNLAYDDGGAMMIQGTGNPGLTTDITNCTFYNNKAYGLDGANVTGGAIQYFKNGGSSKMTNTLTGNTFVRNQAGNESSTVNQTGGAVALSGAGFLATASVTSNNTLFIGNKVYNTEGKINDASNYKDISNSLTTQLDNNLINADKGADPQYTLEDVLGNGNVMLTNNYSIVKAGTDKESIVVPTIPIKPEGLADNKNKTQQSGADQRGFDRYKDIGSVEISWVKYNANGGTFTLPELTAFDGSAYYEGANPDEYYDIKYINASGNVKNKADLKPVKDEEEFLGWSTDPNATTADPAYSDGSTITFNADNEVATGENTLYAVWKVKEVKVTVTFDSKGGSAVDPQTFDKGGYATEPLNPEKSGYKFEGWYKEESLTQKYSFADTQVNEDITLYAKWKSTGGGGGTVDPPIPSRTVILASGEKYTDVLTATVLANEKKCPILLTEKDFVNQETLNEIKRLGVNTVIISGGPDSVSEKVVDQLTGYTVTRLSGEDRYGTAEKVGNEVRLLSGNKNQAMLVDGTNFPDVITISSLASDKRTPILLTQPQDLNITTKDTMKVWGINDITIGGSYDSVSQKVENSLAGNKVERLGGLDRYETASIIGEKVRSSAGNKADMILVDGTDFPDGITVNSLAGRYGTPIMLTEPTKLTSITKDRIGDWSIKNVLIAGGTASVSEDVENSLPSYGVVNNERIAGKDRYQTAVKISERFTQNGIKLGGTK